MLVERGPGHFPLMSVCGDFSVENMGCHFFGSFPVLMSLQEVNDFHQLFIN